MQRTSFGCGGTAAVGERAPTGAPRPCTCGCEENAQSEAPWVQRSPIRGLRKPRRRPRELQPEAPPPEQVSPAQARRATWYIDAHEIRSPAPQREPLSQAVNADIRELLNVLGVPLPSRLRRQRGEIDSRPLPPCREMTGPGISVAPADVRGLRHTCKLNFGPSKDFNSGGKPVDLVSTVPATWAPRHPFWQVAEAYVRGWWLGISKPSIRDGVDLGQWGSATGLLGPDLWGRNVRLGWATAHALAPMLDPIGLFPACGFSSSTAFQRTLSSFNVVLNTTTGGCSTPSTPQLLSCAQDGAITASRSTGESAQTAECCGGDLNTLTFCESWQPILAMAELMFWWSARLYSWVADGRGTSLDWWIGLLAARAGVSCILDFSAEFFHELGHRASDGHCRDRDSILGRPLGQCHDIMEESSRRIGRAAWGLPLPIFRSTANTTEQQFQLPALAAWDDNYSATFDCPTLEPFVGATPDAITVDAHHCGYLLAPHPIALRTSLATTCCTQARGHSGAAPQSSRGLWFPDPTRDLGCRWALGRWGAARIPNLESP